MERPGHQPEGDSSNKIAEVVDLAVFREAQRAKMAESPKDRLDRLVEQHKIPRNPDGSLSTDRWEGVPNWAIMEVTQAEEAYQKSLEEAAGNTPDSSDLAAS